MQTSTKTERAGGWTTGRWARVTLASALLWVGCAEAPAVDPSGGEDPASPTGASIAFDLTDLSGNPAAVFGADGAPASVFLFTASDCPVSNRYAPEVNRIIAAFAPQGVEFSLVYADAADTPEKIRQHVADFSYTCRAVRDDEHRLVKASGAKMTPEAVVYDRERRMVYRGRIDDRTVDYGVERHEVSSKDLVRVLTDLVAGERLEFESNKAVGCFIPELE